MLRFGAVLLLTLLVAVSARSGHPNDKENKLFGSCQICVDIMNSYHDIFRDCLASGRQDEEECPEIRTACKKVFKTADDTLKLQSNELCEAYDSHLPEIRGWLSAAVDYKPCNLCEMLYKAHGVGCNNCKAFQYLLKRRAQIYMRTMNIETKNEIEQYDQTSPAAKATEDIQFLFDGSVVGATQRTKLDEESKVSRIDTETETLDSQKLKDEGTVRRAVKLIGMIDDDISALGDSYTSISPFLGDATKDGSVDAKGKNGAESEAAQEARTQLITIITEINHLIETLRIKTTEILKETNPNSDENRARIEDLQRRFSEKLKQLKTEQLMLKNSLRYVDDVSYNQANHDAEILAGKIKQYMEGMEQRKAKLDTNTIDALENVMKLSSSYSALTGDSAPHNKEMMAMVDEIVAQANSIEANFKNRVHNPEVVGAASIQAKQVVEILEEIRTLETSIKTTILSSSSSASASSPKPPKSEEEPVLLETLAERRNPAAAAARAAAIGLGRAARPAMNNLGRFGASHPPLDTKMLRGLGNVNAFLGQQQPKIQFGRPPQSLSPEARALGKEAADYIHSHHRPKPNPNLAGVAGLNLAGAAGANQFGLGAGAGANQFGLGAGSGIRGSSALTAALFGSNMFGKRGLATSDAPLGSSLGGYNAGGDSVEEEEVIAPAGNALSHRKKTHAGGKGGNGGSDGSAGASSDDNENADAALAVLAGLAVDDSLDTQDKQEQSSTSEEVSSLTRSKSTKKQRHLASETHIEGEFGAKRHSKSSVETRDIGVGTDDLDEFGSPRKQTRDVGVGADGSVDIAGQTDGLSVDQFSVEFASRKIKQEDESSLLRSPGSDLAHPDEEEEPGSQKTLKTNKSLRSHALKVDEEVDESAAQKKLGSNGGSLDDDDVSGGKQLGSHDLNIGDSLDEPDEENEPDAELEPESAQAAAEPATLPEDSSSLAPEPEIALPDESSDGDALDSAFEDLRSTATMVPPALRNVVKQIKAAHELRQRAEKSQKRTADFAYKQSLTHMAEQVKTVRERSILTQQQLVSLESSYQNDMAAAASNTIDVERYLQVLEKFQKELNALHVSYEQLSTVIAPAADKALKALPMNGAVMSSERRELRTMLTTLSTFRGHLGSSMKYNVHLAEKKILPLIKDLNLILAELNPLSEPSSRAHVHTLISSVEVLVTKLHYQETTILTLERSL